jgi:hypothetical protein
MAAIALQEAAGGNQSVTFAAANAGGDTVAGGSRGGGWDLATLLLVKNAHTGSWVVTVAGHPPVTVPATTGFAVVPVYGQPNGAVKAVTYSGVTALTVAAIRVGPVPT